MTTLETLKAARKRIDNPENWTRGEFGLTRDGRKVWDSWKHECTKVCSIGAIEEALNRRATKADLDPLVMVTGVPWMEISSFNDTHTHAEVLAAFDAAIAKLEAA